MEPPTDDRGVCYVRENGKLYAHTEIVTTSGFRTSKHACVKRRESPVTHMTESDGHLPCSGDIPSLFDLCLVYVATSVQNVDSLVGFPDVIAEKIFGAVVSRKVLHAFSDRSCAAVLKTFDAAYSRLLLDELTVSSVAVLEQHVESISAFNHVTKLDLSGCLLADDHDILLHISHLTKYSSSVDYFSVFE